MSDIAAHLVDEVLPNVPIRQWVCSLPWRLRYAMGYDRRLCADVLAACYGASVNDSQLLGAAPGQRTRKLVHPVCETPAAGEALADVGAINVHAGPAIDGRDASDQVPEVDEIELPRPRPVSRATSTTV